MLLAHLAGEPDPRFPGGYGGGTGGVTAEAAPERRSIHQQAADLIAGDQHINRCPMSRLVSGCGAGIASKFPLGWA